MFAMNTVPLAALIAVKCPTQIDGASATKSVLAMPIVSTGCGGEVRGWRIVTDVGTPLSGSSIPGPRAPVRRGSVFAVLSMHIVAVTSLGAVGAVRRNRP